jgi:hypothetical protein
MIVVDEIYKGDWPQGEWQRENDIYIWRQTINDYDYYCLIARMTFSGSLNGYVGVEKKHFLFNQGYSCNPLVDIVVHGGLTYSGFSDIKIQLINEHLVNEMNDNDLWWFGFDTGHSSDYLPYLYGVKARIFHENIDMTYKNKDFMISQVNDLVLQLSNLQVKYDTYTGNKSNGVNKDEPRTREELFEDE